MSNDKRATKAATLRDYLLTEMQEYRIPVGGQLPTETQLMEQFSLSRGTVNRVLTDLGSRGVVLRQQGKGTFRADLAEQTSAPGKTMLVGVWFNMPGGPFYAPIAAGIRKELARWGYHAVFEEGGLETGAERRGIEDLIRKNLDGFIVAPSDKPADDHGPLTKLIDRGVSVVLVDRLLPGQDNTDLVTTNSEQGGEEIVQHLIKLGHRRIGFIGTAGLATIDARLEGCHLAMRDHGLPIDYAWVQMTEQTAFDDGREAAREMLALPPEHRPTALFGANDVIAQTIVIVARERGLRVPEDLSVAGFDNVNVADFDPINIQANNAIELTTYAQPKERMGQQAARLLIRRIQEPSRRPVIVLLEGELVERASTTSPPEPGDERECTPEFSTKGGAF